MTKSSLLVKIGSEIAEISINITISNICGAQQMFDNLNQPLKKRDSALYVLFQPMTMLAFCWLFRAGYNTHKPAGP